MSNNFDQLMGVVDSALFDQPRKTASELREMIGELAKVIAPDLDGDDIEKLAREIEVKQGIKAGLGAVVDSADFEPWLDDAKPEIEPFYWNRYQKLLLQNGLPKDVVIATDMVTDTLLSRLGNPSKRESWRRRGLVVGHVQSGKTSNYTGLICKAADAGYRLVIVLAGIHNNLRNQTQERLDEGFVGFDSGKEWGRMVGGRKHVIGAGNFDPERRPVSLTTRFHDFNKTRADSDSSEIGAYVEPVILVIKKNYRTLGNLLDWLKDNSVRGDHEMIDQPMLLIDDEADNASINTKYGKNDVTRINGQIRDLLNMFHRSCYVGYTATPFANIFVDPDQDDEMYKEDLFPNDFIIGLDAPSNYFGPTKVFSDGLPDEGMPTWLRYITDNEDVLPVKHPKDFIVEELPPSLLDAMRAFVLSRTIRNIRGDSHKHSSMLVNASWRNIIQRQIRNQMHEALERIQNAARINGGLGDAGLRDPELSALRDVWKNEFQGAGPDWREIQSKLHDSIASAKVVEVNGNSTDQLDYPKERKDTKGKAYIAVGGYSLSRGLTLEGLTITWFLRNTMMYDTLMQMGRWFGYRGGYEDLCRIWMPAEAIGWYAFIANAADELHEELKTMEKAKATPRMFGLAVRSHPASLLVTARNKLGSAKKITTLVGLSNKFVETSRVSIQPEDLQANTDLAKRLVDDLNSGGFEEQRVSAGTCLFRVPVEIIDRFLAGWRNAEQSITTDPGPIRQYIHSRKDDELSDWDVLITGLRNGEPDNSLGRPIIPITRSIDPAKLPEGYLPLGGPKMRISDASFEKAGLTDEAILGAEADFRARPDRNSNKPHYPGRIYRSARDRPLFMLMLVKPLPKDGTEKKKEVKLMPSKPVVAWGISLPISKRPAERVEYVVNTVRFQELFGEDDDDEDVNQETSFEIS
ncbi:Z1 domain-containing protein [Profundibacter sp.]